MSASRRLPRLGRSRHRLLDPGRPSADVCRMKQYGRAVSPDARYHERSHCGRDHPPKRREFCAYGIPPPRDYLLLPHPLTPHRYVNQSGESHDATRTTSLSLFLLVAAVVFYLFFRIMLPFLIPICWAAVFTIIFFPLQKRLLNRVRNRNLAALLMCLLVLVLIIGPVTYLFVAVVYQAADAVAGIDELYASGQLSQLLDIDWPFWQTIKNLVSPYHELTQIDLDRFVKETIGKVSAVVLDQTTWLIANATKTVFSFGLMIFTMFYLFRDGDS